MPMYRVGSSVFLSNLALRESVGIGTVVNVIPSGSGLSDFTLYEVEFATGRRRLHGPELRAVHTSFSRCDERDRLWVATMNALHTYVGASLALSEAAGTMAHTEFEFIKRGAEAAKQALGEARIRLDKHTFTHGC